MLRTAVVYLLALMWAISAPAMTSQEAVGQLRELQNNNRGLLEKTDRAMQEQLKKTRDIKAQHFTRSESETSFTTLEESIAALQEQKREYLLRHDFLNELTNKFASSFGGGDARDFIEKQTIEMAATEMGVGSFEQPAGDSYWRFLMYLSVAIRELPEQIENPFKFTESFMNFSTITNPKKPGEFRAQRNYFNSRKVESGKPLAADKIDGYEETPSGTNRVSVPQIAPIQDAPKPAKNYDFIPKPESK